MIPQSKVKALLKKADGDVAFEWFDNGHEVLLFGSCQSGGKEFRNQLFSKRIPGTRDEPESGFSVGLFEGVKRELRDLIRKEGFKARATFDFHDALVPAPLNDAAHNGQHRVHDFDVKLASVTCHVRSVGNRFASVKDARAFFELGEDEVAERIKALRRSGAVKAEAYVLMTGAPEESIISAVEW